MKNLKKRVLPVLLALIIVASLAPVSYAWESSHLGDVATINSVVYDITLDEDGSLPDATILDLDITWNYLSSWNYNLSPAIFLQAFTSDGDCIEGGNWGYVTAVFVPENGDRQIKRSHRPVLSFREFSHHLEPKDGKIYFTIYAGYLNYPDYYTEITPDGGRIEHYGDATDFFYDTPVTYEIDLEHPSGKFPTESTDTDEPQVEGFSAEKDGWSFVNGSDGFQYPKGYAVPEERYREVFGSSYLAAAKTALGETYHSMIPEWTGNCYGMSATAILFYLDMLNWEEYASLYEENFETVNDYYETIRWKNALNPKIFTSSDIGSEITNLIERYQIFQYGTAGGYKREDSTYKDAFSSAFMGNKEEYRGWFTKSDTYSLNTSGKYIQSVYQKICSTDDPLMLDMHSSHGGHTVVVRTDRAPEEAGDGWYRVYVYDPNTPYLSENIIQKYGYEPQSYYLNNLSGNRYIELNPEKNQWRYAGSIRGDVAGNYWGSDADGAVRYHKLGTYKDKENGAVISVICPEYMYVYSIKDVDYPLSFDGSEIWKNTEETTTSIAVTNKSNFVIHTTEGTEVCQVRDGIPVANIDGVEFVPHDGMVEGGTGVCGGRLTIPYLEFSVEYESGDDISIIGSENVISIASDGKIDMDVSVPENRMYLLGNEDSNLSLKLTNVYGANEYTSVDAIGLLDAGDGLTIKLFNDALSVESQIIGDSVLNVYTDYETAAESQHVTTLKKGGADTEISDIRDSVPVSGIELNKSQVLLNTIGDTETLIATISPVNATNKILMWVSSNEDVATVDNNGIVTAVSDGTAVISVITKDGSYTATCDVTVNNNVTPPMPLPDSHIIVANAGSGGSISPSGNVTVEDGTSQKFDFIPDRGYHLATVIIDGKDVTSDLDGNNYYVFELVSTGHSISAFFEANSVSLPDRPSGNGSSLGYSPTIQWTQGGTVAVDPRNPQCGEEVIITPKPDKGYELEKITVTNRNDDRVRVETNSDGTYTFIQPTGKVKIRVSFKKITTEPLPFSDVPDEAWYADAVRYAYKNGLMIGTNHTTFAPDTTTTRGMVATILWRMAGSPVVNYDMTYQDVASDAYYAEAIRWATSVGILSGYSKTAFGPNDHISREQLAVMLYRCEQSQGSTFESNWTFLLDYPDWGSVNQDAYEAMCWCTMNGIIVGMTDGSLQPQSPSTRAQVASMLMRFSENDGR